jgi:SET domain
MHTHLSHALVRYLGLSSPEGLVEFALTSAGDLVDLISRVRLLPSISISTSDFSQFVTNTFTVTSPSLTPLGASVSPVVALINHSCDPNAVIVFPHVSASPTDEEPLMHVVALRSIEANEEVHSRPRFRWIRSDGFFLQ